MITFREVLCLASPTILCTAKAEQNLGIVYLIKHTVLNSVSKEKEENCRCAA